MPAGRGQNCEACYWAKLLEKRLAIGSEAFASLPKAQWFREFGEWLPVHVGSHKAAITINRYLQFFVDVAAMGEQMRDADALLARFTTLGLRRQQLPVRFLEEKGYVVVTAGAKNEASDLRRVTELISNFPEGGHTKNVLDGYLRKLQAKLAVGLSSAKSVRLALSPAAALLRLGVERDEVPPSQGTLQDYLARTPGQRAALSGFVRYLRESLGVHITLPPAKSRGMIARRRDVETKLAGLLVKGIHDDKQRRQALALALVYFHGLDQRAARANADLSAVTVNERGDWAMHHDGRNYWLPVELGSAWAGR